MSDHGPFQPFVAAHGFALLDGGLSTELEARGRTLDDHLWSAELLRSDPEAIESVHRAFLASGADCITTAAYQGSVPGFVAAGLTEEAAEALLLRSSEIAVRARDRHVAEAAPSGPKPLVAASIGPYGAFLADGSEYDGRYGVSVSTLRDFHRERLVLLASSGVDLLACETVPSATEAEALVELLAELDGDVVAWVSFSCRDGRHLHDGTRIEDVAAVCDGSRAVMAVGVNCTSPRFVPELVARAASVTGKPLLAYPNSGERYEASTGRWRDPPPAEGAEPGTHEPWLSSVLAARDAGATLLGGCCRVGPDAIRMLREALTDGD